MGAYQPSVPKQVVSRLRTQLNKWSVAHGCAVLVIENAVTDALHFRIQLEDIARG